MSDFKVDNGIPLPPRSGGKKHGISKYPKLDVGQSFFSTITTGHVSMKNVWPEQKFARRKVIENGVEGIRIWRIE